MSASTREKSALAIAFFLVGLGVLGYQARGAFLEPVVKPLNGGRSIPLLKPDSRPHLAEARTIQAAEPSKTIQVQGLVMDATGGGVAGATVVLDSTKDSLHAAEDGRWALEIPVKTPWPGELKLAVSAEGFRSAEVRVRNYEPGALIAATLQRVAKVSLQIEGAGRSVAGARVVYSPDRRFVSPGVRSGVDGIAHLEGLAVGDAGWLHVSAPGFVEKVYGVVVDAPRSHHLVQLSPSPEAWLNGTVLADRQRSFDDLSVQLEHVGGVLGGQPLRANVTDDGHFYFYGAPLGKARLSVRGKDAFRYVQEIVVTPGENRIELSVGESDHTIVRGVVRRRDQQSTEGVAVSLLSPSYREIDKALTDSEGAFEFHFIGSGFLVAVGRDPRSLLPLVVTRADTADLVRVDLGEPKEAGALDLRGIETDSILLRADHPASETIALDGGRSDLVRLAPGSYTASAVSLTGQQNRVSLRVQPGQVQVLEWPMAALEVCYLDHEGGETCRATMPDGAVSLAPFKQGIARVDAPSRGSILVQVVGRDGNVLASKTAGPPFVGRVSLRKEASASLTVVGVPAAVAVQLVRVGSVDLLGPSSFSDGTAVFASLSAGEYVMRQGEGARRVVLAPGESMVLDADASRCVLKSEGWDSGRALCVAEDSFEFIELRTGALLPSSSCGGMTYLMEPRVGGPPTFYNCMPSAEPGGVEVKRASGSLRLVNDDAHTAVLAIVSMPRIGDMTIAALAMTERFSSRELLVPPNSSRLVDGLPNGTFVDIDFYGREHHMEAGVSISSAGTIRVNIN